MGESEQRIYALSAWRETPFFNNRERAALAFAESVTLMADTHVPDEAYLAVAAAFNDREVSALVSLIIVINAWNAAGVATRAWEPGSESALDQRGRRSRMPALPWKGLQPVDPGLWYPAMASHLPLRAHRSIPGFLRDAMRIRRPAGAGAGSRRLRPQRRAVTQNLLDHLGLGGRAEPVAVRGRGSAPPADQPAAAPDGGEPLRVLPRLAAAPFPRPGARCGGGWRPPEKQ